MNKKALYLATSLCLLGVVGSVFAASTTIPNPLGSTSDFKTLLLKIAGGVGMLVASLGTLMIIIAGILYLTSAGSPERINTAKKALTYAVIGIVIGGAATAIVEVIMGILK